MSVAIHTNPIHISLYSISYGYKFPASMGYGSIGVFLISVDYG